MSDVQARSFYGHWHDKEDFFFSRYDSDQNKCHSRRRCFSCRFFFLLLKNIVFIVVAVVVVVVFIVVVVIRLDIGHVILV